MFFFFCPQSLIKAVTLSAAEINYLRHIHINDLFAQWLSVVCWVHIKTLIQSILSMVLLQYAATPCDNYDSIIFPDCSNAFKTVEASWRRGWLDISTGTPESFRLSWISSFTQSCPVFLLFLPIVPRVFGHPSSTILIKNRHGPFILSESALAPSLPTQVSPLENTCILLPIFKRDTHTLRPNRTSDSFHDLNTCS